MWYPRHIYHASGLAFKINISSNHNFFSLAKIVIKKRKLYMWWCNIPTGDIMKAFIITTIDAYLIYLLLTAGSGNLLYFWSLSELLMGIFLSVIVGVVARNYLCKSRNYRMLNPLRWFKFLAYGFGSFFLAMAKANFDVAYRVITGKIRPGIVKINPYLKTDYGLTFLANSITLTPGTLSVDVDEDNNYLFVHWINVKKGEEKKEFADYKYVCGTFPLWARRVAE